MDKQREALINWFKARQGKVTYSMARRNGPNSYDCSSAVFYALIEAGILPKSHVIGNTDTLFSMSGKLLIPIRREDVREGDIFVAGVPGASGGAFGHCGVVLNSNQIIHCNASANGISITPITLNNTGTPVQFYRLNLCLADNPPQSSLASGWIPESGRFRNTLNEAINIRTQANVQSQVIGVIKPQEVAKYDQYKIDQDGYVWIRQPRSNNYYGYIATGTSKNGKRNSYWGNFY